MNLNHVPDYSGLQYNIEDEKLWIISDEGSAILRCTTEGKLIEKFEIEIEQAEGIAIDIEISILYVVSDPQNKLYIYKIL